METSPNRKLLLIEFFALIAVLLLYFGFKRIDQAFPKQKDLKVEVSQLHTIADSEDWRRLVQILDHSMVRIPAGEFLRGSDNQHWDEKPQQLVYVDEYDIDRYEITNIQYQRFVQAAGQQSPLYWKDGNYPSGQADYPVVGVTWSQADQYCRWAGKRLPTEAEWEKACRGTDGREYPWGNIWDPSLANIDLLAGQPQVSQSSKGASLWDGAWTILQSSAAVAPGGQGLRPVGSYPEAASPYGVLDMAGNGSEWVADWYIFRDYEGLSTRNPFITGPEWNHALRGSSWYDPNGSLAWEQDQSRCSARNSSHVPVDARVGFRCARSVP